MGLNFRDLAEFGAASTGIVGSTAQVIQSILGTIVQNQRTQQGLDKYNKLADEVPGQLKDVANDWRTGMDANNRNRYVNTTQPDMSMVSAMFGNDAVKAGTSGIDTNGNITDPVAYSRSQSANTIGALDPTKSRLTQGVRDEGAQLRAQTAERETARRAEFEGKLDQRDTTLRSDFEDIRTHAMSEVTDTLARVNDYVGKADTWQTDMLSYLRDESGKTVSAAMQPFAVGWAQQKAKMIASFKGDPDDPELQRRLAATGAGYAQQAADTGGQIMGQYQAYGAKVRTDVEQTMQGVWQAATQQVQTAYAQSGQMWNQAQANYNAGTADSLALRNASMAHESDMLANVDLNIFGQVVNTFNANVGMIKDLSDGFAARETQYAVDQATTQTDYATLLTSAIMSGVAITAQSAAALMGAPVAMADFMGPANAFGQISDRRTAQFNADRQYQEQHSNNVMNRWLGGLNTANNLANGIRLPRGGGDGNNYAEVGGIEGGYDSSGSYSGSGGYA